jgi:16S rRNA processing protein RimM
MSSEDLFDLGFVEKAHGLSGDVKVSIDSDDPGYYQKMESVYIRKKDGPIPFFVESIQITGNKAIIKFEGVDSREEAEELKSGTLMLPVSMLPVLQDDQYYYHDLIGCEILDDDRGSIGNVQDVLEMPADPLLVAIHKGKEVLIPLNEHIVKNVNVRERYLNVNLPAGLLEI